MNLLKLLIPLFFISATASAQGTWKWGKGATGPGQTEGFHSTVDPVGDLYGAGVNNFSGHFGTDSVTGNGIYVVKYDSSGNYKWVVNATSPFDPLSLGITADPFGNVYILGAFIRSITMAGRTLSPPSYPNRSYFIAKIDTAGTVRWIKSLGNVQTIATDDGSNIISDSLGNLFVTCSFTNDAIIGSDTLINDTTDRSTDILVAKLDSSGTPLWATSFGGNRQEWPTGIALTPMYQLYITGMFNSDSLEFGPALLTASSSVYTTYLAKLDNNGNGIWAKGITAAASQGLVANGKEAVFMTGYYHNTTITIGTITLPFASGSSNGFLSKFDSSGNVMWVKAFTGYQIVPYTPVLDLCGNVWVSANFGTGVCTNNIDGHILTAPAGSSDPFMIAGWNDFGVWIQASLLTSGGDDRSGLAVNNYTGTIYVMGDYKISSMVIGPDTLLSGVEYNFAAKYDPGMGCRYPDPLPLAQHTVAQNTGITIYPNPADATCTVICSGAIYKNASMAVYDLTGKYIHTYPLTGTETRISIANLPPGMYVCHIDADGNGPVSKKLVVKR